MASPLIRRPTSHENYDNILFDKAQIDIEFLDGGIPPQVIVQAGTRAFQVGSRIAVLEEPGDDLAILGVSQEKCTEGGSCALGRKEKVDEKSPGKDTRSIVI